MWADGPADRITTRGGAILPWQHRQGDRLGPEGPGWPQPIYAMLMPGNVGIATWHILHSVTRNELGTESHKNLIFRIRNQSRQPDKVVTGGSDHPDRGWHGEFLEYEPGNNPWHRSKDAMCDMWAEW